MKENPGERYIQERLGPMRPRVVIYLFSITRVPFQLFGFSFLRPFAIALHFNRWAVIVGPHRVTEI